MVYMYVCMYVATYLADRGRVGLAEEGLDDEGRGILLSLLLLVIILIAAELLLLDGSLASAVGACVDDT